MKMKKMKNIRPYTNPLLTLHHTYNWRGVPLYKTRQWRVLYSSSMFVPSRSDLNILSRSDLDGTTQHKPSRTVLDSLGCQKTAFGFWRFFVCSLRYACCFLTIFSIPAGIYLRNTSGMVTVPSAFWKFSKIAMINRGLGTAVLLSM
jgi:hypothetical protein